MDNLGYHGGIMLKRHIENSGRSPALIHYAVALMLAAREADKGLEDMVQLLIEANEFDGATNKLDKDARIRQLGF